MEEKDLKKFGMILGTVIPALFGILLPLVKARPFPYWPWLVALALVFSALVFPKALGPLHRVWMAVGDILGWINTRLILSLLFFLVFTPAGWIRRRMKKTGPDYRTPSRVPSREEMERPY